MAGFRGKVRGNMRAAGRLAFVAAMSPVLAGAAALQGLVFRKSDIATRLLGWTFARMLGMKVVLNGAALPQPKKDAPVWYVANHITATDGVPFLRVLPAAAPVGHAKLGRVPVLGAFARAHNFIGVWQSRRMNPRSRGRLIAAFNKGRSVLMFPEGHADKGGELFHFHAGLFSILHGDTGIDDKGRGVALEKKVVVQPVALRVKSVDGRDAIADKSLMRDFYALPGENSVLKRTWRRMQVKRVVIELTPLAPLRAADFLDPAALMEKAAREIAAVASPGQTKFKHVRLPQAPKEEGNHAAP